MLELGGVCRLPANWNWDFIVLGKIIKDGPAVLHQGIQYVPFLHVARWGSVFLLTHYATEWHILFWRQCLLNRAFGITDSITLFCRKSPQVSTFHWICPGYWSVPVQFMQWLIHKYLTTLLLWFGFTVSFVKMSLNLRIGTKSSVPLKDEYNVLVHPSFILSRSCRNSYGQGWNNAYKCCSWSN